MDIEAESAPETFNVESELGIDIEDEVVVEDVIADEPSEKPLHKHVKESLL